MRNKKDNTGASSFRANITGPTDSARIRVQAEQKARSIKPPDLESMTREEILHMVYEMQVKQIEARLENERLHTEAHLKGETVERKRAEEALRASEELLLRTQEIAHTGSWRLDLSANRLTWSDEVYRIFGCEPQEFAANYEAFLDFVHPDDRAAVDEAYSRSQQEGCDAYEIEHRIVRRNSGEVRYVHERCVHERDAAGTINQSTGMVQDITERLEREFEYSQILNTSIDGFWVVDTRGYFMEVNPAAVGLLGYTREEMLALRISDVEATESPEEMEQHIKTIKKQGYERFETQHRHKDGHLLDVEVSTSFLAHPYERLIVFTRDISERKQNEREDHINRLRLEILNEINNMPGAPEKMINDLILEKMLFLSGSERG